MLDMVVAVVVVFVVVVVEREETIELVGSSTGLAP
jgi:hypothetical protein